MFHANPLYSVLCILTLTLTLPLTPTLTLTLPLTLTPTPTLTLTVSGPQLNVVRLREAYDNARVSDAALSRELRETAASEAMRMIGMNKQVSGWVSVCV